jgi:hypothetical protein
MNEWFQAESDTGLQYTATRVDEICKIAEVDEAQIGDSINWYPVFAMTVLERAGAVD